MNTNNFSNQYINWIKSNISEVLLNPKTSRITTPFLDFDSDAIEIYIDRTDGGYYITDDGATIANLDFYNLGVRPGTHRDEILTTIVRSFGVTRSDDGQLYVIADDKNLGLKMHLLIQCVSKISDMLMLSENTVKTIFSEDVRQFFIENDIFFNSDISVQGKSSYYTSYDFVIPNSKSFPERFVTAINHPTSSMFRQAIFFWDDVRPNRPADSLLYLIVNDDKRKMSATDKTALNNYGIKHIAWSKRNQNLADLRLS
mgnify:CR=1 FL=1